MRVTRDGRVTLRHGRDYVTLFWSPPPHQQSCDIVSSEMETLTTISPHPPASVLPACD